VCAENDAGGGFVRLKIIGWIGALIILITPVRVQASGPGQPESYRVQYGEASWYGASNQGRVMASGVRFDEYAMTAAHPTLPMGRRVEVTNLRNGRSAIVRIMDRGPYIAGRIIDLSRETAYRLRFTERGIAPVKVRVLSLPTRPIAPKEPQTEVEIANGILHGCDSKNSIRNRVVDRTHSRRAFGGDAVAARQERPQSSA
jgi:rare lipoprotein A